MKKVLLALALIAAMAPPTAAARPGALDPSFGGDGRIVRSVPLDAPAWDTVPTEIAKLRRGELAIRAGRILLGLEPSGKPNQSFGGGTVRIELPPRAVLQIANLAVDGQGRIVIGSTAASHPPHPHDADVHIVRYERDGLPDPGFGERGALRTDLGFPPPFATSTGVTPEPNPPLTGLGAIAVDEQGNILVAGTRTSSFGPCKSASSFQYSEAFVARLHPDGGLDPSFGEKGVSSFPGLGPVYSLATDRRGRLYVWGANDSACSPGYGDKLMRLRPDGGLDRSFADGGSLFAFEGTFGESTGPMAVTPGGTVLLSGHRFVPRSKRSRGHMLALVRRVLPSGRWDAAFGRRGVATFAAPRHHSFTANDLAVEASGRIVLAGTSWPVRSGSSPRAFMVGRLTGDGALDGSFGQGGRVRLRFGKRSQAEGTSLAILPRGRILVSGTLSRPSLPDGEGVAVARLRSR